MKHPKLRLNFGPGAQLLALSCLLLSSGCSSFHKEWKSAVSAQATPNPARRSAIEGPWRGEWRSDKNGHHGSLRAIITQTGPTTYRAHYRARFMKVLRYTYVATLHGEPETQGVVKLAGSADLGKLAGGVYNYEATAGPDSFASTYRSKHDHGKYEMKRP